IVTSIRPGLTCCVNVAFTPPDRMKLPSLTARTRRSEGSNVTVIATVDNRDAFVTEIGTVYGPPPTRIAVPGGDTMTCARPIPGEVVVSAGGCGGAGAFAGG